MMAREDVIAVIVIDIVFNHFRYTAANCGHLQCLVKPYPCVCVCVCVCKVERRVR